MENVNCLLCKFPWDLFLFLLLLGFILWWLLRRYYKNKYQHQIDELNDKLGVLESKHSGGDDDCKERIARLQAELEEQRSSSSGKIASLEAELAACNEKASSMALGIAGAYTGPKDDLKVIEGIGPKIEELFNNAGIYSFAQLATTEVSVLQKILDDGGPRFQIHNPGTWPRQAALARDGKMEELLKWQDELKGGIEE